MTAKLAWATSIVGAVLLFATPAAAQGPISFSSPDAPLPGVDGTGLSAWVWSSPAIDPVDDLLAARAYASANSPNATFLASAVDYPNGIEVVTSTDTPIVDALGVDGASLSDPTVGAATVLNSIMRFAGFLRVNVAGTLNLGVGSDDGSELLIQGVSVVNNDGIHSFPGVGPTAVEFTSPGLYAVEILFFESQATGWGFEFYTDAAGAGTPIPTTNLYPVPEPMGWIAGVIGLATLTCLRGKRSGRSLGNHA